MLGYRIAPQQERIHHLREQGFSARIAALIAFDHPLDFSNLHLALTDVFACHEALQTLLRIPEGRSRPIQMIRQQGSHFLLEKLENVTADNSLMNRAVNQDDPLPRFFWMPSESGDRLALSFPGELIDSAGINVFFRDLQAALVARSQGRAWQREVVQFSQYSAWQETLEHEETELSHAPWSQLNHIKPSVDLKRFQSNRFSFVPPTKAIAAHAKDHLEYTIAFSWLLVLANLKGEQTLTLAWEASGRSYEELADVVGPFSRYLPLGCHLPASQIFTEALDEWTEQRKKALDWQDFYGLGKNQAAHCSDFGFFYRASDIADTGQSKLLDIWDVREPHGLLLEAGKNLDTPWCIHFDTNRYNHDQVALLAKRLGQLMSQWDFYFGLPLQQLSWVLPEEETILATINQVEPIPRESPSLLARFESWAAQCPQDPALVGGAEHLTYEELNLAANRLAHYLLDQGLRREDPVLLVFDREPKMVIAMLAVLKAGGAYVPIDANDRSNRFQAIVQTCRPAFWLTTSQVDDFEGAPPRLNLDHWDFEDINSSNPSLLLNQEQLAYIIFTSGSTGKPKGVAVSRSAIAHYLDGLIVRLKLNHGWSYGLVSTMAADLGQTCIFGALGFGGNLHLLDRNTVLDGESFANYVERERLDCLKITPSHLAQLLTGDESARAIPKRRLILGGEAAPPELLEKLRNGLPQQAQLFNHYGPTETTIGVLAHRDQAHSNSWPLGKPMAGNRAFILNEGMQRLVPGSAGELFIGGGNLARGYYSNAAETARVFLPDPFGHHSGARLYRTGDRVRLGADGSLYFVGRVDHQLKIRGYRVEPKEIEHTFQAFPGIAKCLVRLRDHQLVLYYTVVGEICREEDLRKFGLDRLPEYMIPNAFIVLPAFPLNANGKLDETALPALQQIISNSRSPQTKTEQVLAAIWQELFHLDQIDVSSSFFELGGNSLLAIRLIGLISKHFHLRLSFEDLNAHVTLESLATYLDSAASGNKNTHPILAPLQTHAEGDPWFCVHPSSGEVHLFQPLADALEDVHPFFGLRSPLVENPDLANTTLVELATSYVNAIRTIQPKGPYLIAGFSLGGTIAYEMASQIMAAGDEVTSLVLIDAWYKNGHPTSLNETALFWDFLNEVLPINQMGDLNIAEICQQQPIQACIELLAENFAKQGLEPLDAAYLNHRFRNYRQHRHMVLNYAAQPYDGEVILIRASASIQSQISKQDGFQELASFGWREAGLRNLKIYDVQGDHHSIWNTNAVQNLKPAFDRSKIKDFVMKRVHHEVMVHLTRGTGNFYADRLLTGIVATYNARFGDRLRAVLVTGSHARQRSKAASDLDLHLVFQQPLVGSDLEEAESIMRRISQIAAVPIDYVISNVPELFRLKYLDPALVAQVHGAPLELPATATATALRLRLSVHIDALFCAKIRGLASHVVIPLSLPDATDPYGGYLFEDTDVFTGKTYLSTRELANVVLKTAMAIIAMRTGIPFVEKSQLLERYREVIGDRWITLLEGIFEFVRGEWAYAEPEQEEDRACLKQFCRQALDFENHFMTCYRAFLLKEIEQNPQGDVWLTAAEINEFFGISTTHIQREIDLGHALTQERHGVLEIFIPNGFRQLAVLMMGQFVFPDPQVGDLLASLNGQNDVFLAPQVRHARFLWNRYASKPINPVLVGGLEK